MRALQAALLGAALPLRVGMVLAAVQGEVVQDMPCASRPVGDWNWLKWESWHVRNKNKCVCVWSNAASLCCLRARIVACHARQTMGIRMTLLTTERLF